MVSRQLAMNGAKTRLQSNVHSAGTPWLVGLQGVRSVQHADEIAYIALSMESNGQAGEK